MNRKLLFKIGGLAALVAPIATVVSCGTTTSANAVDAKQDTTNRAAAATSSATASTGFNQYQPKDFDIDKKDATDFRAIETYQGEVDMSVWRAAPVLKTYDDVNIQQWIKNAKIEGWRSVEDYQKYLQYVIETNGPSGYDKFAGNSVPDVSWLSWNYAPGQKLNQTYNVEDIKPSWINAENESWNDIDNTIAWYQYDTGGEQFAFDANNIDNAWKRLVNMERLIPTTANSIRREASEGLGADGTTAISGTNPAVTRNKYMVDGELLDALPSGFHKYYYVTNDRNEFVRDDNGWKVIVTDRDKEKSLSTIINPADSANTGAPDADGDYPNARYDIYHPKPGKRHFWVENEKNKYQEFDMEQGFTDEVNKDETIAIKAVSYGSYNKNPDFKLEDKFHAFNGVNGIPKLINDPSTHWSGKYTITLKKDNFTNLVKYPYSWFPMELQNNATNYDRFGQIAKQTYTHPWAGTENTWQWVEDGHGGHKVYKSLDKLRKMIPDWRAKNYEKLVAAGDTDPASTFKIFANWHHVFPVREWFVGEADIYKDEGL